MMSSWVSSALFFGRDVDAAIGFYVDRRTALSIVEDLRRLSGGPEVQ